MHLHSCIFTLQDSHIILEPSASMKSVVFLNGLLLLFLLHHWTESVEGQEMNLKTLARIIDFFEKNYKNTTEESYAVAINVPRNQCEGNFVPSNESFLTQEKDVKNAIYKTDNKFYNGTDLMAEGPWPCNCKVIEKCTSKSVSVLLKNDSLQTFKNFAQRRNDSCIVIYTVYSPCLNLSGYDIIPSLDILKNHTGIKAFVFKKVYNVNENDHKCSDLARNFTEIVSRVPLYRFVNNTVERITNEC